MLRVDSFFGLVCIEGAWVNVESYNKRTVLMAASTTGSADVVCLLVGAGENSQERHSEVANG